jgi:hypothetical protein
MVVRLSGGGGAVAGGGGRWRRAVHGGGAERRRAAGSGGHGTGRPCVPRRSVLPRLHGRAEGQFKSGRPVRPRRSVLPGRQNRAERPAGRPAAADPDLLGAWVLTGRPNRSTCAFRTDRSRRICGLGSTLACLNGAPATPWPQPRPGARPRPIPHRAGYPVTPDSRTRCILPGTTNRCAPQAGTPHRHLGRWGPASSARPRFPDRRYGRPPTTHLAETRPGGAS